MGVLIAEYWLPAGQRLALWHGDLTEEAVDAIVNAANERLAHGGGLAGAIVRRGGHTIQAESDAWVRAHGPASHARPALTGAGRLPCRAIIHAVGPVWGSGDEAAKLRTAYTAALALARDQGFNSLAFPSLSTGIFGFPVERAAPIAVRAVLDFCAAHPPAPPREIRFTLIDTPTVTVFERALPAGLGR
ncbi:MAG: macro domain-containing protein [Anaerolineales bacterium]|nr:macro domain-containing protein [Anaerolineales bacterium]